MLGTGLAREGSLRDGPSKRKREASEQRYRLQKEKVEVLGGRGAITLSS